MSTSGPPSKKPTPQNKAVVFVVIYDYGEGQQYEAFSTFEKAETWAKQLYGELATEAGERITDWHLDHDDRSEWSWNDEYSDDTILILKLDVDDHAS